MSRGLDIAGFFEAKESATRWREDRKRQQKDDAYREQQRAQQADDRKRRNEMEDIGFEQRNQQFGRGLIEQERADNEYQRTLEERQSEADLEGLEWGLKFARDGMYDAALSYYNGHGQGRAKAIYAHPEKKGWVIAEDPEGNKVDLNPTEALQNLYPGKYKPEERKTTMIPRGGKVVDETGKEIASNPHYGDGDGEGGEGGSGRGRASAQVDLLDWYMKNVTNGDAKMAVRLSQLAKSNPQELAVDMILKARQADVLGERSSDEIWADVESSITRMQNSKLFNPFADDAKPEPGKKQWPWQEGARSGIAPAPQQQSRGIGMNGANPPVNKGIDQNLQNAIGAIEAGKDPAAVVKRLLDNGYTAQQLNAAGIN